MDELVGLKGDYTNKSLCTTSMNRMIAYGISIDVT